MKQVQKYFSYFNSQPREGGWGHNGIASDSSMISTHSRAKAAGYCPLICICAKCHFNSQPREGGWLYNFGINAALVYFNSQPREGGWVMLGVQFFFL